MGNDMGEAAMSGGDRDGKNIRALHTCMVQILVHPNTRHKKNHLSVSIPLHIMDHYGSLWIIMDHCVIYVYKMMLPCMNTYIYQVHAYIRKLIHKEVGYTLLCHFISS